MSLPRLLVVGDRRLVDGPALVNRLREASRVLRFTFQLRERDLDADEIEERGAAIEAELGDLVSLTINVGNAGGALDEKRVELALARGWGAHAPESASTPAGSLPRPWTRAVHSADACERALREGADAVVAGHVFASGSKPGLPPRGVAWLESICRGTSLPVFAIGGIDPGGARRAVSSGAYGVAVRAGLLAASDPVSAASDYHRALSRRSEPLRDDVERR